MTPDLFSAPAAPVRPSSAPAVATPCANCVKWEQNPNSGTLHGACDDCTARDIAQGINAWKSVKGIDKEPLRQEILIRFGDRALTVGRGLVWEWCKRLKIGGVSS